MELKKEIHQSKPFRSIYHKATVNLIFTGKWIINLHHAVFRKYDLTVQQYNILRILSGQYPDALTIKLIRQRMLDKMSDASRIVEHLRKKELVDRIDNTSDRRKVDIIITQKGLGLLDTIEKNESNKMDNFLSSLTEHEIAQLDFLLDKCRH
ncbi:MAG: MarR family winged helix-turn-helix transcriptional regulator [Bacteroidia bacterium]